MGIESGTEAATSCDDMPDGGACAVCVCAADEPADGVGLKAGRISLCRRLGGDISGSVTSGSITGISMPSSFAAFAN